MFDHLIESSHRDDSNKWSNKGFGEEITQVVLIEVNYMHLIWCSDKGIILKIHPHFIIFKMHAHFAII